MNSPSSTEGLLQEKHVLYTFSGHDFLIKCLNPEHIDNSPSLRIDRNTGIGHCFSCGFKLNIFKYYNVIHNVQSAEVYRIKEKIQKIYASSVGLEMPLGYSLYNKEYRGISAKTLNKYDAFTHKEWENRIVFPLRDITGKIKAFIGRHIFSDVGKRYDIKPSGAAIPFFPFDYEITDGCIILVEGIFDALNLIDKGLTNTVSINGLQTLNDKNYKQKLTEFKLRGVGKVYLLYDGDDPGRKQAEMILPLIQSEGLSTESIDLPDDTDPGILSQDAVYSLKEMINNANSSNR